MSTTHLARPVAPSHFAVVAKRVAVGDELELPASAANSAAYFLQVMSVERALHGTYWVGVCDSRDRRRYSVYVEALGTPAMVGNLPA